LRQHLDDEKQRPGSTADYIPTNDDSGSGERQLPALKYLSPVRALPCAPPQHYGWRTVPCAGALHLLVVWEQPFFQLVGPQTPVVGSKLRHHLVEGLVLVGCSDTILMEEGGARAPLSTDDVRMLLLQVARWTHICICRECATTQKTFTRPRSFFSVGKPIALRLNCPDKNQLLSRHVKRVHILEVGCFEPGFLDL